MEDIGIFDQVMRHCGVVRNPKVVLGLETACCNDLTRSVTPQRMVFTVRQLRTAARRISVRPRSSPAALLCRFYRDMANLPVNKTAHPFSKGQFEALLNRRFFYAPAFEIYGGMCL